MRTVQTGVDVAAEPSVVWGVLTDFASYPTWSSYVQEITGSLTKGGRVRVVQGMAGRRPLAFRARVLDVAAERGFTWRGGLPGLFVGTHEFALTALPGGGTHLLQRETFRGLVARVVGAPRGWVPGFSSFNEAVRRRAESRPVQ